MRLHHRRVVLAVQPGGHVRVDARQDRVHQLLQAVADQGADLLLGQGRPAVVFQDVVDAGGDGGVAVGQGAVEIEQDGAEARHTGVSKGMM